MFLIETANKPTQVLTAVAAMAALANVGTDLRFAIQVIGRISSINRATDDVAERLHPVAIVERPCERRPRTLQNDDTDKYILFEAKKPLSVTLIGMPVLCIKFYGLGDAAITGKRVLWRVDTEAVLEADMPAAALEAFARLMGTVLPPTWQKLAHLSLVCSSQYHTAAVKKAVRDALTAQRTTPLGFATKQGNVAAVRRLVSLQSATDGTLSTADDGAEGWTALHIAAALPLQNDGFLIGVLLSSHQNCARVSEGDPSRGITPLHRAAWFGHMRTAMVLLHAGADPTAKTKSGGYTPADLAFQKGFGKLAAYLRQACRWRKYSGPTEAASSIAPSANGCNKRPREEPPCDLEVVGTLEPDEAEAERLARAKATGNYIELE